MLRTFLILIALQFVGDLIAALTSVPVPGMVIGMVLLLAGLWLRGRMLGTEGRVPESLSRTVKGLHDHLGLLFVPAGAGVMANFSNFAADGAALLLAVLISTSMTIAITASILARRQAAGIEATVAGLRCLRR